MKALILIPSRLASTRLPNKPLADIAGKPMILHVMEQAEKAGIGPVIIASGDSEISAVVRNAGGKVVDTDPDLASGSDRIYQALSRLESYQDTEIILNVQGDLPLIRPEDIARAMLPLTDASIDIGTLIAPVKTEFERTASSVVKVACSFQQGKDFANALYFSRASIPWGEGELWHHVGIYAYRRKALERFVALPPSALEQREKLEQLRALEAGMKIGCARIEQAPLGVDTADDLERVRQKMQRRKKYDSE